MSRPALGPLPSNAVAAAQGAPAISNPPAIGNGPTIRNLLADSASSVTKKLGARKQKQRGSIGTKMDEPGKPKTDRTRTTPAQFEVMVTFLETPANFDIMVGAAATGKSVVAGSKLTKKHGNQLLANH
ncbi:hypothetical protein HK101_003671, partial [Irineochytrium annulatum]